MPTYQYICRECETEITETRGINDPEPVHVCTQCGNKMNKVYNLGAVTFRGSGFYSKDK
jgi:putative FmdB family regulatory protein